MEKDEEKNEEVGQEKKINHKYWWWAGIVLLAVAGFFYYSYYSQQNAAVVRNDCITAEQAWNSIGKNTCVEFTVGYTYVSKAGNAYLDQYSDYSKGFEVWIPSNYSFGSDLTSKYANKTIYVSGTIKKYQGAPEIEVTDPSQVQLAQ
jgi:hypothetical protein